MTLFVGRNEPARALPHARALAEDSPLDSRNWLDLYWLLQGMGDIAGEIDALRWRSARDPDDADTQARLAKLLARTNRETGTAAQPQVIDDGEERATPGDVGGAPLPPEALTGKLKGQTLVLPHAYKTGGTSLYVGLTHLFGLNIMRLGRTGRRKLMFASPAVRSRLDLLVGHFEYSVAEQNFLPLLPNAVSYVGVVRDPVARAKSIYAYFREIKQPDRLLVPDDDDINVVVARWLEASDKASWRHDQCRVICGATTAAAAIEVIESRYLAVVTTSHIHKLHVALARSLSLPDPTPVHAKGSRAGELVIEPDLERRLRAHHGEDQKLFDWVTDNQERMIERAMDSCRIWNAAQD